MPLPAGLILRRNYITEAEEEAMLAVLRALPPAAAHLRHRRGYTRMIRFGHLRVPDSILYDVDAVRDGYISAKGPKIVRRSYRPMNDGVDLSFDEIPEPVERVIDRLVADQLMSGRASIVVFNEYHRGQRIGAHIDHRDSGREVPILSLLSDVTFGFASPQGLQGRVKFPRRALLVLTDEARYQWKHWTEPALTARYAAVFRQVGREVAAAP